jgi:DeoR/GlpR family transcriptional regulator of sugar metabolism
MFTAERRRAIVDMVRTSGAVSLHDLAQAFGASEVTVRRDIRALEEQGLLDRRRGGAVWPGGYSQEPTYEQKRIVAAEQKAAIAHLAATFVEEDDAVIIGAGTTTRELARRLVRLPHLTVVTNSLLVAQTLAHSRAEVVVTGGYLRGSTYALVGTAAERSLTGLRVRRAFLSGNGLTRERGLSTPNMQAASVDQAIVESAQEVVVLADHTKVGSDTMFRTVEPGRIAHLITDDRTAEAEIEGFRALGIAVHVAPTGPEAAGKSLEEPAAD